ncbi:Eco57I restriction-modification methylase domain-containing protein [Halomonas sp. MA07-2]|uniref:Eco57I restriction-modification methylase domain-containing protein n=1 Tax=Halomonas sp. MA07-2 TaxID=3440841 RepID=UPI003EEF252F
MDPCCGSGHFLVAALLMLVPMRMELEGLNARDAVDAVLRDNLHGLEIDQRCVELAAFALALTAWRYPDAGGYRSLPELHLACSGLPISVRKSTWLDLSQNNNNLSNALEKLYDQFKLAPQLGSLIDPGKTLGSGTLFETSWREVSNIIESTLENYSDDNKNELSIVAKGTAKSAKLLSGKYHLIATNVPYLKRGSQPEQLTKLADDFYTDSKQDLATMMISRWIKSLDHGGIMATVSMQSMLTKKGYTNLRQRLLDEHGVPLVARLGSGAFEAITGEVVSVALYFINNSTQRKINFIDIEKTDGTQSIIFNLLENSAEKIDIADITADPALRIRVGASASAGYLRDYADALHGQGVGDGIAFYKKHWERELPSSDWEYYQLAPATTAAFSGREDIVLWEKERGRMAELAKSVRHLNHKAQQWRSGKPNWGHKGIVISLVGEKRATLYTGQIYGENCCVVIPKNSSDIQRIWRYVRSGVFAEELLKIESGFAASVKTMLAVPYDPNTWEESHIPFPDINKPFSNDPVQWIYHGHPCGSVVWDEEAKCTAHGTLRTDDTVLQVAVARLLGYRWPAEKDPEMELAEEQREWVNCCEELLDHADRDGIVCLPAVRGERRAVDRLEALLADAYGDQWSATTRGKLLESVDHAGKDLESWLRDKFFAQHCKLFQNRPFIWHIWDGLKDGFSALVNYHKLDYKALETLTYTYLGDWITQQKKQIGEGVDGAEGRLAAAEALQKSLELILEGEEPYDIFVRWKPLEEQPIGWHPDLNDGVRLNIRPFLSVPDVKRRGAGVLVHKPNIHWKKDRGKDVESAPWYNLGPQLGGAKGDRINDYHLTLAAKKAASKQAEGK